MADAPNPSSTPASSPSAPTSAPSKAAPSAPSSPAPSSGAPSSAAPPTTAGMNTTSPQGASSTPDVKKAARKLQIKVDGEVEEVDLESLDDNELTKRFQMAKAANKRMQEAAEARKQFDKFYQTLEKDPLEALKSKNIDVRKLVEEQILREYEESQMQEPERKVLQRQRELEAREAKIKEMETQIQAKHQTELEERVFQETRNQFLTALESANLPRSDETLYMMADIARINLDNGIDVSPQQMAAEVKNRMQVMHTNIVKDLKGEQLAQYLGDSVVAEVLKFAVEKVKAQQNQQAFQPQAPSEKPIADFDAPDRPQRRQLDIREWRKYMKGR